MTRSFSLLCVFHGALVKRVVLRGVMLSGGMQEASFALLDSLDTFQESDSSAKINSLVSYKL